MAKEENFGYVYVLSYSVKHISPCGCWETSEGKLLSELYDELYPMED